MTKFRISTTCSNTEFLKFNLESPLKGDWEGAADVFSDRFESRYFNPIKQLMIIENTLETEGDGTEKFHPGFISLSIDFILLETLNQFKNGINDTNVAFHTKCSFVNILRDIKKISAFFDSDAEAGKFYDDLRCGLIHQGQTKGESRINKSKDIIVDLYKLGGKGFNVNRTEFHNIVLEEYSSYSNCIKNLDNRNFDILRINFRNKMHFLCGTNLPQSKLKKCLNCSSNLN
jgi:hypothetical protein